VNRKLILVIIFFGAIIFSFLVLSLFFETHFLPGTMIGGVNVSGKTVADANRMIQENILTYELILRERGNVQENLKGADIGLKYDNDLTESLKSKQNEIFWCFSWINQNSLSFNYVYTFNDQLLRIRFDNLSCFDPSKVIDPKNATLVYSEGAYRIIKEVFGSKVKEKRLYVAIQSYIMSGKKELNLNRLKCYYSPDILSNSLTALNTETAANKYLGAVIIYSYDGGRTVIDQEVISQWIEFDNDLTIKFNNKKIKRFVLELADNYNTYAKFRNFKTSSGTTIQIGGGDYGWLVDVEGVMRDITDAIVQGKTILKKPKYSQKGAVLGQNDLGQTYVEINLSKQHLWYYNDDELIAQGDIVSGDINDGYKTPEGIYSLKFRIKNAVLDGENYQTMVSYWMPFNNDIGIHDATWRSSFGGNIYLTNGSHGCINAPFSLAEILFNHISVGTPIICYY
jgi:uncharacterized protein YktA (UPF0223 family)